MIITHYSRLLITSIVLNAIAFSNIKGQSQEYSPSYLSKDFIFKNWTARDGLPVNSISSIVQTEDGYIWLGTADGLVRFNGIEFKTYATSDLPGLSFNRIKGLVNYSGGILILNSKNELVLFVDNEFRKIGIPNELIEYSNLGMIEEEGGIILFTHDQSYRFSGERFQKMNAAFTRGIRQRERGEFAWENFTRILNWRGEKVIEFPSNINEAIIDKEGVLWVVTHTSGLFQLKKNLFETYSIEEGLPGRNIYPIAESLDSSIWIGTYGNGIASMKNGIITSGYLFKGINSNTYVHSILQRKNGDLLVALMNEGLYTYSGEKIFLPISTPQTGTIYCLFEDSKERLWMGTLSGLYFYENYKWHQLEATDEINANVLTISEAPDGSLWAGTNGKGLLHIHHGDVTSFGKSEGLSSDLIRSLWVKPGIDKKNYDLWVGTEDNGLNKVSIEKGKPVPLKVTTIGIKEGLFDRVIHKILYDDLGRVWMSTNRGVFWVFYHELEQFSRNIIDNISSIGYTEQDGLRNREANGGVYSPGTKTKEGILWLPTQDGVIKINPELITHNSVIPAVKIEQITTETEVFGDISEPLKLELGDRNVNIDFAALSYISPEKNQVKYRLFGFDDDWQDSNKKRSVRYTNLNPGQYTFKVIASNNSGIWNQQGAVVKIKIPPYFYESVWFYFLIGGIFLLQVGLGYKVTSNRARRALKIKEDEILNLKENLKELNSKVVDQKALKQSFLFNIKKELSDPVILLREQLEHKREPLEKVVDRETKKLLSYVNQLVLLAQVEIDEVTVNPKAEDLVKVVRDSIAVKDNNALSSKPLIEFNSNTEKVKIYMDVNFMKLVFQNLIQNALERGGASKIRIEVVEESSICTVKIIDYGKALSHEELHTIFSLFKTSKLSTEDRNSVDINLPLVAKLIELHKGTILVHSIPQMGNTFSVVLKKGSSHF